MDDFGASSWGPSEVEPGRNTILVCGFLAIPFRVSRYLICMAEDVFKISAASRMSLAESTSALAAMTLDSPILFAWAAEDKDSCNSFVNDRSLIKIDSILTPHNLAAGPMISSISLAIASLFSIQSEKKGKEFVLGKGYSCVNHFPARY